MENTNTSHKFTVTLRCSKEEYMKLRVKLLQEGKTVTQFISDKIDEELRGDE